MHVLVEAKIFTLQTHQHSLDDIRYSYSGRKDKYLLKRRSYQSMSLHRSVSSFKIKEAWNELIAPLLITFRSTYQSPSTVKTNDRELVIGTVRLRSVVIRLRYFDELLKREKSLVKWTTSYQLVQPGGRTTQIRLGLLSKVWHNWDSSENLGLQRKLRMSGYRSSYLSFSTLLETNEIQDDVIERLAG